MSPDWIALVALGTFVVLCVTHYMALKIGWNLGTKGDPVIYTPKAGPVGKYQDPFDKEMFDID